MKAAGTTADGVVFPMGAQPWTADVPGMKLVHDIAKPADPKTTYKPVHYVAGVCAYYYMKEAMEWADKNGGITGPNIKQGMYQKKDWVPAGLEGRLPEGDVDAGGSPRLHRGAGLPGDRQVRPAGGRRRRSVDRRRNARTAAGLQRRYPAPAGMAGVVMSRCVSRRTRKRSPRARLPAGGVSRGSSSPVGRGPG